MHITTVTVEGFGPVKVHHNSDWSGRAEVVWHNTTNRDPTSVSVPAGLFKRLAEFIGWGRETRATLAEVRDGCPLPDVLDLEGVAPSNGIVTGLDPGVREAAVAQMLYRRQTRDEWRGWRARGMRLTSLSWGLQAAIRDIEAAVDRTASKRFDLREVVV